jgi:hypothetical protein
MSARNLLREWKINNISFYRELNWSFLSRVDVHSL